MYLGRSSPHGQQRLLWLALLGLSLSLSAAFGETRD
jgi:hypothetical protein